MIEGMDSHPVTNACRIKSEHVRIQNVTFCCAIQGSGLALLLSVLSGWGDGEGMQLCITTECWGLLKIELPLKMGQNL